MVESLSYCCSPISIYFLGNSTNKLLLCTDGLSNYVGSDNILRVINDNDSDKAVEVLKKYEIQVIDQEDLNCNNGTLCL